MAGKFVLKKGASGKFHFNLLAANGQIIATSEAYNSKEAALNVSSRSRRTRPTQRRRIRPRTNCSLNSVFGAGCIRKRPCQSAAAAPGAQGRATEPLDDVADVAPS